MTTYISSFSAPGHPDRDLLGGKGADLARMVQMGLPVPPGFTITTAACRHVLAEGTRPPGLARQLERHLAAVEEEAGRRFGDPDDPLLLAVRSGAAVSMPGMMDTVLDVGLTDATVAGLVRSSGDERFAWDCYRRLVQMFGETVLGVAPERFTAVLSGAKDRWKVTDDTALGADALREVVESSNAVCLEVAGRTLPQDPFDQLDQAVHAVFGSWQGERARAYRRRFGIDDGAGTAVNVQAMVYGNHGPRSGSGVAFTRDPETGEPVPYGEYLPTAQGEDVVAGTRTAVPLSRLHELDPAAYQRLRSAMGTLERNYRDMCDVEFTVEDGRLWILQTRVGKRSPAAAFRIAADFAEEGWITEDEALLRVSGEQLTQLLSPRLDEHSAGSEVAAGLAASPGAATGRLALDSATAAKLAERGEDVVLLRPETRAEDLPGMLASRAIVTARGGRTSHAAVVARGMGLPAVCGVSDLEVDLATRQVMLAGTRVLAEGDVVTVDGTSGRIYRGRHRTVPSEVAAWLEGGTTADSPVVAAVARLLEHADGVRRLRVLANAETAADVRRAMRLGAQGVGLCRTEHLLLGERRAYVEGVLLGDDEERTRSLQSIADLHREGFALVLDAAQGGPVTIRLLDAPLHEFLPDVTELALRAERATDADRAAALRSRLAAVERFHEANPMTGLRGVRLAILRPEIMTAQVTAALDAAADLRDRGRAFDLELMVPLVSTVGELEAVARVIAAAGDEVAGRRGRVPYRFGTMVETPRAALTADLLAGAADFLSFGTNDLTQLTWGLSRDDAERTFLPRYEQEGIVRISPFVTLDRDGVGALLATAVARARAVRASITVGVCGEHGADPASIGFFENAGVDYVSCSPPRVPVARLEAGRAAVAAGAPQGPGTTTSADAVDLLVGAR
ncbi:pyruvate, phosphate dikinase [Nocardioides aromaticivorans]|uniref:Pyruvate, phosphate dikinase n=1 Tax=Nocardioides aromaticivorans TaxID=200618 RepID=A0ABX7PMM0_9ACTN|nr:pyruvate, phosphate dikinase [Nocardioides aromaticivorans]QSR26977.1 pyruvate, phosphate dikinase [Nocardioides aromaticivorans]